MWWKWMALAALGTLMTLGTAGCKGKEGEADARKPPAPDIQHLRSLVLNARSLDISITEPLLRGEMTTSFVLEATGDRAEIAALARALIITGTWEQLDGAYTTADSITVRVLVEGEEPFEFSVLADDVLVLAPHWQAQLKSTAFADRVRALARERRMEHEKYLEEQKRRKQKEEKPRAT